MPDLPTARATVAARLRQSAIDAPDEARILAAAEAIEAGEADGWTVRHEMNRMEVDYEVGDQEDRRSSAPELR